MTDQRVVATIAVLVQAALTTDGHILIRIQTVDHVLHYALESGQAEGLALDILEGVAKSKEKQ